MVKVTEFMREEAPETEGLDSGKAQKQNDISVASGKSTGESRALKYRSTFRKAERVLSNWAPRPRIERSAPYQVIDFFSGCGGMSLGFAAVGKLTKMFEVVGGCDIDSTAADSFRENIGAPCAVVDISELATDKASIKKFLRSFPRYDPKRDTILIGCAPCQGFSSHRKKAWAQPDKRNSLPADFAKVVSVVRPICVVMENVPEMLSGKYLEEFSEAKHILQSAGYVVKQAIYNAAEFGVPQERFRAVVLAMRRDFLLPKPIISDHAKVRTVRDAIGDLPKVLAGERIAADPLHYSANHNRTTLQTIQAVKKNGGSRPPGVGPACLDRIKGFSDVYGRLYWDRPAITITHYARNPASGRFVHPEQDRGLTIRECAQLQSFPRRFQFSGNSDAIYKQIGEAVPPLMSLAIASHLLVELQFGVPRGEELELGHPSIESPVSSSYSSVIAGIKVGRSKK
jgi:DNA (cytosine-5)-methyltransferase 1